MLEVEIFRIRLLYNRPFRLLPSSVRPSVRYSLYYGRHLKAVLLEVLHPHEPSRPSDGWSVCWYYQSVMLLSENFFHF